jgi:hypothetical protein
MRTIGISFLWALAACLLSLGTALTPWFTLSARVSIPEISRHDECIFEGPDWKCSKSRKESPAVDPGALSWQEIPAHYFFNRHLGEERPLWNPYIGSGYPIFLDGITRSATPSRMFLDRFPGDGARDLLIFLRLLVFTWGVLFALMQVGVSGRFLLPIGIAATMLPMVARFVDIIFLDVDLMAPWIFALSVPWLQGRKIGRRRGLAFGLLGLWVGLQAFVQSQVVFCLVLGIFLVLLVKKSRGESLLALFLFSIPFFAASLPSIHEFKKFFPEFVSNRQFLGCASNIGTGLSNLWYSGYVGYLKNSELGTVYALLGVPLVVWGAYRNANLRYLVGLFGLLFVWMAFGSPSVVCSIQGLNGIHVARHLTVYLQSLYLVLAAAALYFLVKDSKYRKVLLTLGFLVFIYPALNHNLITYRHLTGTYARAVNFSPEPIPESNVYSGVQRLSRVEDRRHFAPDWRMYPNYSAIFEILDMRVLYGLFPKRVFALNDSLFKDWHEMPAYGHADRFVGPDIKLGYLPADLEKLMVLHRVSLLTFSKNKNWIEKGGFYNLETCQKRSEDELAVFYFCPQVGGVGFFPREVVRVLNQEEGIKNLKSRSSAEVLDFAVIEDVSDEKRSGATGGVLSFQREPNRLTYDLDVQKEGYFVVADAFFPGWKATVNQIPAEILPANIAFKAVFVPAGRIHLELEYDGKKTD